MDRLRTLPPLPPRDAVLSASPFWIGSGKSASLTLLHPVVRERHIGLVEREDGWWVVRGDGDAVVNGQAIGSGVRIEPGATIVLAPGCSVQYERAQKPAAAPVPGRPPAAAAPATRRRSGLKEGFYISPRAWTLTILAAVLLGGGGFLFYKAMRVDQGTANELSVEQSLELDSLMVLAFEHVERGNSLLEFGAPQQALREFASAITVLQVHPLHRHPAVTPRIAALERAVSEIYQARRMTIPDRFSRAPRGPSLAKVGLNASLTPEAFASAFESVAREFQSRFGSALVVTGRDHAEHLSLYGSGGAFDLRTRDLPTDRVQWIVAACRSRGIRVKDFTTDDILRRQIQAAVAAGVPDRAGTGLHLHVDRFAGRRDRWTIP